MPVIDRHRYTVGWKSGYRTQKRLSEPTYWRGPCDMSNLLLVGPSWFQLSGVENFP
jgi:hypothetical protein